MADANPKQLLALVAEDEPAMLSLVARHLRSLGFSVVEAGEGDLAWEAAQQRKPDLVLLDVMMPGMSGWEICKRLKGPASDGRFADTAVIMLTGIGENLNEMTSPLFAADAWLNKPFDFRDLDTTIQETLARYRKPLPPRPASSHASPSSPSSSSDDDDPASRPTRKATPARAAAGKAAKKKAPAKKAAAKTAPGKKAAAKKAPAKKAPAKKAPAKKAPAKKAPAKKAPAKKAPARRAAKKPAKTASKPKR